MKNTTSKAPTSLEIDIMGTFAKKLHHSGYSVRSAEGILESGVRCYFRKLRLDLQGRPRLNGRENSQDVQRRGQKIGGAQDWFKRRRGGAR